MSREQSPRAAGGLKQAQLRYKDMFCMYLRGRRGDLAGPSVTGSLDPTSGKTESSCAPKSSTLVGYAKRTYADT